jgi:hypothetical protein
MCVSEVWALNKSLRDNKVGPVKENGVWANRTNGELMDLCREQDIISEIRKGRL